VERHEISFTVPFTGEWDINQLRDLFTSQYPQAALDNDTDMRTTLRAEDNSTYRLGFTVPDAGNVATFSGDTGC
jgi:hypothetical protein